MEAVSWDSTCVFFFLSLYTRACPRVFVLDGSGWAFGPRLCFLLPVCGLVFKFIVWALISCLYIMFFGFYKYQTAKKKKVNI